MLFFRSFAILKNVHLRRGTYLKAVASEVTFSMDGGIGMPIHVFWDNPEQNIVRQEFVGRWTSDEYVKNVLMMYDMIRVVPHKVHIIVDMTHTEGMTSRMIAAAPRFNEKLPENRGLTVGINVPRHLISITNGAS